MNRYDRAWQILLDEARLDVHAAKSRDIASSESLCAAHAQVGRTSPIERSNDLLKTHC
jgi:hypothetical protein